MASYRLHVRPIKRSAGRSVTAAAAYRAGCVIECARYGETHDFSRKGGVLHTEIMTPENTPAWMRDRAQLWNAVEKLEARHDAQLAREVQLSLPHELTDEQRRDLVRSFIAEQFVAKGMIADIALHAPGKGGDTRNYHAHVLLTMRELTGDGFGNKDRSWNKVALLKQWRVEWDHAQNRELERLGIDARVDHRSLKDQGIDREPDQHMGPIATSLDRQGKGSRIAEENARRRAANDNRDRLRAEYARIQAEITRERQRFEEWSARRQDELESRQFHDRLETEQRLDREAGRFEDRLRETYDPHLKPVQDEARAVQERLEARGLLARARRLFTAKADRERLDALEATIRDAEARQAEQRGKLEQEQAAQRQQLIEAQERDRQRQLEGIRRARERKAEALAARLNEAARKGAETHRAKAQDAAENRTPANDRGVSDRGNDPPTDGRDAARQRRAARNASPAKGRSGPER